MTLLKKVGPTIMSANVVKFNVATQLNNIPEYGFCKILCHIM